MSAYDSTNIKTFDNEVIKEALEEQLTTALDMNAYITADYSLSAAPGMTIEVHTYHGTGDVEDLDMGDGNTGDIGAEFTTASYTVGVTQGRVPYYDEQQMNDPTAIDKAIKYLAEQLTNNMTAKIVAELQKGSRVQYGCEFKFANIVDAVAALPKENNEGLFMLINKADAATMRKELETSLRYVEDFVRTGYIGTVAGVNVIMSNAIPAGKAYIATKEAVTAFIKKGVEIEQARDANTRKNTIYGRQIQVIALTNDDKVIRLVADDPTEGYTLLTSAPADWATDWDNYFEIVNDEMTALSGTAAPTFATGKYYSQNT